MLCTEDRRTVQGVEGMASGIRADAAQGKDLRSHQREETTDDLRMQHGGPFRGMGTNALDPISPHGSSHRQTAHVHLPDKKPGPVSAPLS